GKCLIVVIIPASCIPFIDARPNSATFSGDSPKERTPITGLLELLFTSIDGAKFQLIPNANNSLPVAYPISYAVFCLKKKKYAIITETTENPSRHYEKI